MALKNIGVEHEVVGICETDIWAVINYTKIHCDPEVHEVDVGKELEDVMTKNIGFDVKKQRSMVPSLSNVNKYALAKANKQVKNFGDISLLDVSELPEFDLFTYSFPCQDISRAVTIKEGLQGSRSGLLYECEKIIRHVKPRYLLLENVKDLVGTKLKNDFDTWLKVLDELGYHSEWKVLNAKNYGIPQNRERVFVVSVLHSTEKYVFPKTRELSTTMGDFLDVVVDEKYTMNCSFELVKNKNVVALVDIKGHDLMKRVQSVDMICPTINTVGGGNREPKVLMDGYVRKLTPNECWRLMGIADEHFNKVADNTSNTQLYKQAGNAIVVPVLEAIFRNLFD